MRPRLLRRCLLLATLGLVTSVVVAWGLAVRYQTPPGFQAGNSAAIGSAVVDGVLVRVLIIDDVGYRGEEWYLQPAPPQDPDSDSPNERHGVDWIVGVNQHEFEEDLRTSFGGKLLNIDHVAARGAPVSKVSGGATALVHDRFGLPWLALGMTVRADRADPQAALTGAAPGSSVIESSRGGLELPWHIVQFAGGAPPPLVLPLAPRPGLLGNTIFYALLWALFLLAPGAIRRRIRRARGRCPKCGYSLTGQSAPGCPECGHGREAVGTRPQHPPKRQGGPAPA